MIRFKKIIAGFLFVLGLMLPMNSFAVTEDSAFRACPDDYYSFMFDVGIKGSRTHYFKDFFTLGYCQLYDIMELYEQLDSIRDNFRTAAFACEETKDYKTDYYRILMEVYFVRNVQSTPGGILNVLEIQKREDPVFIAKLLENLKDEMKGIYVEEEGWVSEDTLDDYFERWESKYEDKIGQYGRCEEGVWAEISEMTTDFVETIQEGFDFSDLDTSNTSFMDTIKPQVETDSDIDIGEIGHSVLNSWKYFQKDQEEAAVENVPQEQTAGELTGIFSIESALQALEESEVGRGADLAALERMAKYKRLYGEGGALGATNMQGILKELNEVVEESNTKHLPKIQVMASQVYDKQCN